MIANPNELTAAISQAIMDRVKEVVDEEANAAAKRVEERVRGETGMIAGRVLHYYTMEQVGQEIRIRVEFPEKK